MNVDKGKIVGLMDRIDKLEELLKTRDSAIHKHQRNLKEIKSAIELKEYALAHLLTQLYPPNKKEEKP